MNAKPMSTRDVVETAIDLRKADKTSTWADLARRATIDPWWRGLCSDGAERDPRVGRGCA